MFDLTVEDYSLWGETGVVLQVGRYRIQVSTEIPSVSRHLSELYAKDCFDKVDGNIDFHVSLKASKGFRRWFRKQVVFTFDGYTPFLPLPFNQAPALFEWGLNWCIANHSHQYLVVHAAAIEKNGVTIIFPGTPGSGKSTLCASLVCSGWRLLSDEMALISVDTGMVHALARPISLKNESIHIIKHFFPENAMGEVVNDTAKGSVSHLRPPDESVINVLLPAKPTHVIFPKYMKGSETLLKKTRKGRALLKVAENCFNYNVLGDKGFELLSQTIDRCKCYEFNYEKLEEALIVMDGLD